ncbi:MAG: hypothetical protein AB8G96_12200 [Phycisphaerales bacterium]
MSEASAETSSPPVSTASAWADGPDRTYCPQCRHELWPALAAGRRRCGECGTWFRLTAQPLQGVLGDAISWARRALLLSSVLWMAEAVREIIYVVVNMVAFGYSLFEMSITVYLAIPLSLSLFVPAMIPASGRWFDGPGRPLAWALASLTLAGLAGYWCWIAYLY